MFIFKRYNQLYSFDAIAKQLEDIGDLFPTGKVKGNRETISKIL